MKTFFHFVLCLVGLWQLVHWSPAQDKLAPWTEKASTTRGEVIKDKDGNNYFLKDKDGVKWALALNDKHKDFKTWKALLAGNVGKQAEAKHRPGHVAVGKFKVLLVNGVHLICEGDKK